MRKLENISQLKQDDEEDTSGPRNHLTKKMSMELMNEVGREMMTKTTKEIKSLSMMLQKIFSPGKKLITVEADGIPREIPVHESDYVNFKVPLRGIRDGGLTFNIKALDFHDRCPSSKVDLRVFISHTCHHPNENNHDMSYQ